MNNALLALSLLLGVSAAAAPAKPKAPGAGRPEAARSRDAVPSSEDRGDGSFPEELLVPPELGVAVKSYGPAEIASPDITLKDVDASHIHLERMPDIDRTEFARAKVHVIKSPEGVFDGSGKGKAENWGEASPEQAYRGLVTAGIKPTEHPQRLAAAEGRYEARFPEDGGPQWILAAKPILRELPKPPPSSLLDGPLDRSGRYELGETIVSRMRAERFQEWYYSHFFFDRNELLEDVLRTAGTQVRPPQVYDVNGERAFDGYLKGRRRLFRKAFDRVSLEDFDQAHADLMSRSSVRTSRLSEGELPANSEGIADEEIGAIRDHRVGYDDGDVPLRDEPLRRIDGRKLEKSPERYGGVGRFNPFFKFSRSEGGVEYAALSGWRRFKDWLSDATRERLKRFEQKLMEKDPRLRQARSPRPAGWKPPRRRKTELLSRRGRRLDNNRKEVRELRRRALTELVEHNWETMRRRLVGAGSREEVLRAVGEFYYAFISIHPYVDGNGRVGRLIVERTLHEFNLPPPIWAQFGEDLLLHPKDFMALFMDSVALSQRFHEDLDVLTRAGVDYQALATAFLTPDVLAACGGMRAEIVPEEFMACIRAAYDPERGVETDASIPGLLKSYLAWKRSRTYLDSKDKGIRLVPPLFVETFNVLSPTREHYDLKMELYYDRRRTIQRGISLTDRLSNEEILSHFVRLDASMTGMGLSEKTPANRMRAVFDEFNVEIARKTAAFMERVHSHAGVRDGYWTSKLTSFTGNPKTVTDFKRGDLMGRRHRNRIRATMVVQVAARKVGSVLSADVPHEKETLLVGAADPESVRKVVVEDTVEGQPSWVTRTRVAERLDFDLVRLMEYDGTGKPMRVTLYPNLAEWDDDGGRVEDVLMIRLLLMAAGVLWAGLAKIKSPERARSASAVRARETDSAPLEIGSEQSLERLLVPPELEIALQGFKSPPNPPPMTKEEREKWLNSQFTVTKYQIDLKKVEWKTVVLDPGYIFDGAGNKKKGSYIESSFPQRPPTPYSPPDVKPTRHPELVSPTLRRYVPRESAESEEEFRTWARMTGSRAGRARYGLWRKNRDYVDGTGGMRLIPPSFMETFNVLSPTRRRFNEKLAGHYDRRKTLYRGISLTERLSNEDILRPFVQLDSALLGMGFEENISPAAMKGVFIEFNRQLARRFKDLYVRLIEHADVADGYWNSGLLSLDAERESADLFKRGAGMDKEHQRRIKSRLEIQLVYRKVGSVDTFRAVPLMKRWQPPNLSGEKETVLAGGADPESLKKVIVEDIVTGQDGHVFRTRVAERVGYDAVRLMEYDGRGKPLRVTAYRIGRDGTMMRIASRDLP